MPSPWKMLIITAIIFSLASSTLAKETKTVQEIPPSTTSIIVPSLDTEMLPNAGRSWKGFFADERDEELDMAFGFKSKIETVTYDLPKTLHTMIFAGWKNQNPKLLLLAAQMVLTQEELGEPDELFPSETILEKASELAVKQKNKKLVQTIAKVWQRGFGLNNKKEAAKYKKIARSLAPPKKTRGSYYQYVIIERYPGRYDYKVLNDQYELARHSRKGNIVSRERFTSYADARVMAIQKAMALQDKFLDRRGRNQLPDYKPDYSWMKESKPPSSGRAKWFKKAPKYSPRRKSTSSFDDLLAKDPFKKPFKFKRALPKKPKYKRKSSGSNWFQTLDDLMGSSSKPYLLLKKPSKYTGDKLTIVVNGSSAHKYHMRSGYRIISGHSSKLDASYAMRHHSRYGNRR